MRISFITILVDLGSVIDIAIFRLRVMMGELRAGGLLYKYILNCERVAVSLHGFRPPSQCLGIRSLIRSFPARGFKGGAISHWHQAIAISNPTEPCNPIHLLWGHPLKLYE